MTMLLDQAISTELGFNCRYKSMFYVVVVEGSFFCNRTSEAVFHCTNELKHAKRFYIGTEVKELIKEIQKIDKEFSVLLITELK